MIQLLAVIGLATLIYLAWRAFGPRASGPARGVGPDDDPDFLRDLGSHPKTPDGQDPPNA